MTAPYREWMTDAQVAGLRYSTRGMTSEERLARDRQIASGERTDKQRHIAARRVCVRCEGPRDRYPVCSNCQSKEGS